MTSPRILVQLSDPHIKHPGALAYGKVDTAQFFAKAIRQITQMKQPVDAIVITGDLTDFGRVEEYQHLRQLLAPLTSPVYLLPGNHDCRIAMRQVIADYHYLQTNVVDAEHDCMQYAINLNGVRLVTVDTVVPMASHGEVSPRRLDHLAQLLAADTHTPTIVAMHHPPFRTHIGHMDKVGLLSGADALQKLIDRKSTRLNSSHSTLSRMPSSA